MNTKITVAGIIVASLTVAACARTEPMQPDRSVFNIDASYQLARYDQQIETTFDKTVAVFRDAGYRLDVVDRATGQISGQRGKSGDKGAKVDMDLRFYALVLPEDEGSAVALRIVQIASQGIPVLTEARTEIVLNQPELYAYIFRRIAGKTAASDTSLSLPVAAEGSYVQ